jgi:TRAP-type C4-dicarboxylate transport system substrate-binding protein
MGNPSLMRLLLAAIVAGCMIGVLNSAADRAEFTIRIAFLASQDDEDYVGALAFKQVVEAQLPGRAEVRIYPSGQYCGNERECIEGLQSGILEVHQTTIGGLATLFGEAQVLDLPYAFSGDAVAECVMDGALIHDMGEAILARGLGLRLMAVGNTGGWRSIGTTEKEIRTVTDLSGLRLRTLPSALEQQMVRALGASPIALPWSEVYSALSAGLLDGVKNSVQDIVGMKLDDHVHYLLVDRHAYMAALWWVSEAAWRKMPAEVQAAVENGFAALEAATRRAAIEREAPALEAFLARGGTVETPTAGQRAEFQAATAGIRDWYANRYGRKWLDALDAAVAACGTQAASGVGPVALPGDLR